MRFGSWWQVLLHLSAFVGAVQSLKVQGASGEVQLRLEATAVAGTPPPVWKSDPPIRLGL